MLRQSSFCSFARFPRPCGPVAGASAKRVRVRLAGETPLAARLTPVPEGAPVQSREAVERAVEAELLALDRVLPAAAHWLDYESTPCRAFTASKLPAMYRPAERQPEPDEEKHPEPVYEPEEPEEPVYEPSEPAYCPSEPSAKRARYE